MGMEITRYWRLEQQRYGLVGEACPHCDSKIFPPRDMCPECSHAVVDETKLKKLQKICPGAFAYLSEHMR